MRTLCVDQYRMLKAVKHLFLIAQLLRRLIFFFALFMRDEYMDLLSRYKIMLKVTIIFNG